jgi:hypothetical protein
MASIFALDPYFTLWFILLLAAAFFLQKKFSQAANVPTTAEFKLFQDNFVLVYIFVVAADWLQGPCVLAPPTLYNCNILHSYVYALYDAYGFTQQVPPPCSVATSCAPTPAAAAGHRHPLHRRLRLLRRVRHFRRRASPASSTAAARA